MICHHQPVRLQTSLLVLLAENQFIFYKSGNKVIANKNWVTDVFTLKVKVKMQMFMSYPVKI